MSTSVEISFTQTSALKLKEKYRFVSNEQIIIANSSAVFYSCGFMTIRHCSLEKSKTSSCWNSRPYCGFAPQLLIRPRQREIKFHARRRQANFSLIVHDGPHLVTDSIERTPKDSSSYWEWFSFIQLYGEFGSFCPRVSSGYRGDRTWPAPSVDRSPNISPSRLVSNEHCA